MAYLHFLNGRYYTDREIERMEDEYYEQRAAKRRKAWEDAHFKEFRYRVGEDLRKLIWVKRHRLNPVTRQKHSARLA